MAQPFVLDVNLRIQNIIGLDKVKAALAQTGGAVGVGGAKGGAKSGGVVPGGAMILPDDTANKTITNMNKIGQAADTTGKKVKKAGQSMKVTTQSMKNAGAAAQTFGDKMKLAGVRYGAFVVATAVPFAVIAAFKSATESVIEFDDALTKLSQILDRSKASLGEYSQEMIRISVETGTALGDISKATKILAQAGFLREGRKEMEKFLEPLAKVPLLASFEGIDQATEGVIAALNQFSGEGLEAVDVLDKLDYVSNKFAITASDLVEGIKRGGGAFSALGGNLDEFIALMTTMRSVTRESGQTIGTSIRTITARMSRPRTIKFLEGLGVEVRSSNGELLGMIDILSNLNDVFERSGKEGKAAIAETLGGFRQISRVLAAIQNPKKIQESLRASQNAAGSIARNAEKGLGSLSAQLNVLGARWIEFIQSMAQPLFIPLIQSATSFLNIVVKVVSSLGPIIPLFTTLVGFAGGIAALSKSMALLGATGGILTKAFAGAGAMGAGMLGGLQGLATGGLAGLTGRTSRLARMRQQGNLGFGAATGAAATTGLGQIPQLLVATGIFAAFKNLSESALETKNSFGFISAEIIKTAAAFAIAASLLSGKSIGALAGGVKGYIGGGLAAGGAAGLGKAALGIGGLGIGLAVAGSMAAAKQAHINIDELVKKAADHINDLDIEITDRASLDQVAGEIGTTLLETARESAKEFEGFGGFFAEFGERMGRFLRSMGSLLGVSKSDWSGIAGAIIDEDHIKEMFKEMYEKSPETFRSMLDEAIEESGPDFRTALIESFASQLPEGEDPRIAELLRNLLIEFTGGEKQAQRKVGRSQVMAEQKKFAAETERITKQLRDVVIPSQLTSQMNMFGYAMDAVTREVELASNTFRELAGNIGQVSAPQIPGEVSLEAIQKGLGKFGFETMMGDFDASIFKELGEGAQVYQQAAQMMQQLLRDLNATEAVVKGQTDSGDVRQNASIVVEDALNLFFDKFKDKFPDKYKDAVRRVMESTAKEWQGAIEDGMQPDAKKLEGRLKEIMKAVQIPTEGVAEGLQQSINSVMQQIQNQIDYEAKRIQFDIGGFQTAEKVLGDFNYAMDLIGEGGVVWRGSMEDTAASFFKYGDQIISLGDEINALEKKRTATFKELGQAVKEGSPEAVRLAENFATLNDRMNALQGYGVTQALQLIEESRQALQQQAQKDIESIQQRGKEGVYKESYVERLITQQNEELALTLKRLDEMAQSLTSTMKVSQLDAVASSAQIYKVASSIFSTAVTAFQKAVSDLSTPSKPGLPKPTASEATGTQKQAQDIQALGGPLTELLPKLNTELAKTRTFTQKANDGLALLGSSLAAAPGLLTGLQEEIPKEFVDWTQSLMTQIGDLSDEQLRTAAATVSARQEKEKTGAGTGVDLNEEKKRTENMFQVLKAIQEGNTINRDQYQLSDLSLKELQLIKAQEEATRKTIEEQIPESGGYVSDQLQKAIQEAQRTGEPVRVGVAPPSPTLVPEQIVAPSVLGATPTESSAGVGMDFQIGADNIRMSAESMRTVGDIFYDATNRFAMSNEGAMMANETFRLGTDSFRMNVETMTASTDILHGVANTMQTIVDLQNQAQIDPVVGRLTEGEAETGVQQVSAAIESLGERVDAVTEAIAVQTQQATELATTEKDQLLEVEGLENNTEVIAENNEVASKTQKSMVGLNEGMTKAAAAMKEGIGIDIETMSEVKVDVTGVGGAAKEFTSEFEAVAHRVAKEEIRVILQQLARAAGSSEAASTFESAIT